jgi:Leucine-rich repeat (LRR) protein
MCIATRLRHLSRSAASVEIVRMSASEDLVCNNLMCEKVGDACVCKLARYIEHIPNLRVLELAENKLHTLPDSLWRVQTLTHLDLRGKHHTLIHIYPRKTQHATLVGNLLQTLPDEIGDLSQLEFLDVSDNQICNLPDSLFALPSLKELRTDVEGKSFSTE